MNEFWIADMNIDGYLGLTYGTIVLSFSPVCALTSPRGICAAPERLLLSLTRFTNDREVKDFWSPYYGNSMLVPAACDHLIIQMQTSSSLYVPARTRGDLWQPL